MRAVARSTPCVNGGTSDRSIGSANTTPPPPRGPPSLPAPPPPPPAPGGAGGVPRRPPGPAAPRARRRLDEVHDDFGLEHRVGLAAAAVAAHEVRSEGHSRRRRRPAGDRPLHERHRLGAAPGAPPPPGPPGGGRGQP